MYIYIYMYNTYILARMHAYMHAYIHACMHTCMHTYIHACMHTCMHTFIPMHACIHTYVCIYIHIYIYIWLWDVMGCRGCTLVHVRSYSMHCILGMIVLEGSPKYVVSSQSHSTMVSGCFGGVSYYGEGICSTTC